ncbi:YtxH domain-containing protein [Sporosarcina sp. G11-34]|uniref:YtxH domain-containing protein n=1 Tax=Sporosarcina sp. G11-34 TaxID=2849605 RepID=UPI0022A9B4F4|nr:YtxH domain-containing protein [Sporosarcina sp. G11-34]MCZ2260235.1 YtxH domain-containing protein [Sporosarcina sp. G11-34]
MGKNKFGIYILFGALAGAAVSMFDRGTREQVTKNVKGVVSEVNFYTKNPDVLKSKVREKKEKIQSVVEQLSEDATYVKEKVDELKLLTPEVKNLVVETKEAFAEAKVEYKAIASDDSPSTENKKEQ